VLDLTRVLAGPTCARTLASYGAQVLRVGAPQLPSVPLFVADTGFGKRSTHLDLTRPDDAQKLLRLIRDSDVFSQGYRTGAMDRLGFGVTEVAQLRPGIIYVSINCYGHEGPWRSRPGWEQLAQTVTGMAHQHGADTAAESPALLPAAVTDYTTGYLAAFGVLVALARRARVGGSYWVRVSLARTGMWIRGLGLRRNLSANPLTGDEIAAMQDEKDTPWGPVRYLRPAVTLSASRVGWDLPPVPLGTHPPSFT
jgi:crotonobetainyl-CoA:carnitine CoA-transferase CaiB-like acyl-CoA transferase